MGSNDVDPQGEKLFLLENLVLEFILILVVFVFKNHWTQPQIVLSDLEQGCSYGPLLTCGVETKRARSIEVQTQGE